jgi:hypothetical protein
MSGLSTPAQALALKSPSKCMRSAHQRRRSADATTWHQNIAWIFQHQATLALSADTTNSQGTHKQFGASSWNWILQVGNLELPEHYVSGVDREVRQIIEPVAIWRCFQSMVAG